MEKTIRALVVEPEKAPYPKEIPHNLTSLQQAVDGWIQAVYPFSEPVAIVCDDEGKLNGKPLNRALRDEDGTIYDVLAGTFLVVGAGETDFISLTPQQEEVFTARFSVPERFVRTQEGLLVLPFPPQPLPVYLQSASYAAAHGELAEYRASRQENLACRYAIEQAILEHYHDNRLDEASAGEVLHLFGAQRVQTVLAAAVVAHEWDGRICVETKAWARAVPLPDDAERLASCNVHPGLLDLFVKEVRQKAPTPDLPPVLPRLKGSAVHAPTAVRNDTPER